MLPSKMVSHEWIIGWKVANLVRDNLTGKIAFLPILNTQLVEPYAAEATARCNNHAWHQPPHVEEDPLKACYCGFNAFAHRDEMIDYFHRSWPISIYTSSLVLLRVALSGQVIEGTHSSTGFWGYRAQHMIITDVFLPNRCYECSRTLGVTTDGFLLPISKGPLEDFPGHTYLVPFCHQHAIDTSVSLNEFVMMADTPPLHWADDVPDPRRIRLRPGMQPQAEYVLNQDDVSLIKKTATQLGSTFKEVFVKLMDPASRFVTPRDNWGSALLTIPDPFLADKCNRRRRVNISANRSALRRLELSH